MKSRFSTFDVQAIIAELQKELLGLRVVNVYDVDNKTYLIRLAKPEVKKVLLFESGIRIHKTDFEWPKHTMPSPFSMKCRKHLRSRRLVSIEQLGADRVVDLQFGSNEAAYHLIVELYDRGNVVLTDYQYTILNLLRRRTDADEVRFAVHEVYPVASARQRDPPLTVERLQSLLANAQLNDTLRKVLSPNFVFGPALLEHCLRKTGWSLNAKIGKDFHPDSGDEVQRLLLALREAEQLMSACGQKAQGFIVQKSQSKPTSDADGASATEQLLVYDEFHPILFGQHQELPYKEFTSFNQAVDEYFSKQEAQKLDLKSLQQEKQALKKLENVRHDHARRVDQLQKAQEVDEEKARLIELNIELVDRALLVLRSAVASAVDWPDIAAMVRESKMQGDPVASAIHRLHLERNVFTMALIDPYADLDDSSDDDKNSTDGQSARAKAQARRPVKVDIDLSLSAYANARHYFDHRRFSSQKEKKTLDSSAKALKSAERKTRQALKDMATVSNIRKVRKIYWFEKFLFFISSENHMVVAGRDQQQNEMLVRRYLKPGDLYVHADIHGASTVIIKSQSGKPIPPSTLHEAGSFALCHSSAWQAKIVTSAWWVHHYQVSKTAPTGEYLTTGSFMIRGKKNFLPPSQLLMGFGFLFKLDESCVARHADDRKRHQVEEVVKQGESASQAVGDDEDVSIDVVDEPDLGGASAYPDTVVDLRHAGPGKRYEYQLSVTSNASMDSTVPEEEDVIYLGDDQPIKLTPKEPAIMVTGSQQPGKPRDQKQSRKSLDKGHHVDPPPPVAANQQQHRRGKKGKLKKIQQRYGDQDDEEKSLRMDLLQSSGSAQGKKGKKGHKGKKRGQGDEDSRPVSTGRSSRAQPPPSLPVMLSSKAKKKEEVKVSVSEIGDCADTDQPSAAANGVDVFQKDYSDEEPREEISDELLTDESDRDDAACPPNGDAGNAACPPNGDADDVDGRQGTVAASADEAEDCSEGDLVEGASEASAATAVGQDTDEPRKLDDGDDDDDVEEEGGAPASEQDAAFLTSLTGSPLADDILLFAVPVCAPYGSMQNYKFKVKLTPGPTKRGKAARTALHMFVQGSEASLREKELLRVVKDNDLSRSFPGMVKVSAPLLQKAKRR